MKKLNPINHASGALKRFALGLAVGAAVLFGVGQSTNAATLLWDFKSSGDPVVGVGGEDPWVPVFPSSNPADVWQSFDGWGWIPDDGHIGAGWDTDETRLIHSPEFYLDGSGDMTFQMAGTPSYLSAPGLAPSAVPSGAIDTNGYMGVALRDIVADTYVLWRAHLGTDFSGSPDWTNYSFTAAQLAPYVIPGRKYTLDWVDDAKDTSSGNGWAILNNVAIPGTLVSPNTNILSFYGNGTISGTNIIKLLVVGTDVTALSPTFTLSRGATCVPASGSTHDFTSPVHYIVTASDGGTKDYLVTVQLVPLSGKVNVNFTGTARDGLGGPRGDSGESWNQLTWSGGLAYIAGGTNGALWDSQGLTTTIGVTYTTDSPGLDEWGNPTLQLIRDGLRNFPTASATGETVSITNLPAGRKYDVYIASANASGGESSDGVFSTTNTTTTVGGQPCVNTGNVNGSTWVQTNNYVRFANVVPDVTGKITILGTNTVGFRLPVNGIQVVDVGPVAVPAPIPTVTGITGPVVGVFTINGSTDIAGNVVTLTTPSLSAPVTWTPVQTNAVPGGAFSFPVPQGAYPNEFYRLMGQ